MTLQERYDQYLKHVRDHDVPPLPFSTWQCLTRDVNGPLPAVSVTDKFDLYAMVKPKTRADLLVLIGEFHAELDRINKHLDALFEACESPEDA